MTITATDPRFTRPLYTATETAMHLGIPTTTVRRWAAADTGRPLITTLPGSPRDATIPFVGLAEAYVLKALRDSGVALQRIRPALDRMREEFDLEYALANQRLQSDGVEVLLDVAQHQDPELIVVRTGQGVFRDVVQGYLKAIVWDEPAGYAKVIKLPAYGRASVVADPDRGFGQPVFDRVGVRVEDVVDMFFAGDSMKTVAREYGVEPEEVEAAIRVVGARRRSEAAA